MTTAMERQITKFQNKIQQEIILKEDEVERLKDDLSITNTEILSIQDQLSKLLADMAKKQTTKEGKEKRQKASVETIKARLQHQHVETLQSISAHQADSINNIHFEFEEKLSHIEIMSEELVASKTKSIDAEIKKTTDMIEKTRQLIQQQERAGHEDTEDEIEQNQEIETQRVERLEKALQDKNKERLDSLLDAKQQLSTCVRHLEEAEKVHNSDMEKLRLRISQTDDKYNDRIRRLKDTHSREMESLRRKKDEAEQRAAASLKQLQSAERQHNRNMGAVTAQQEQLKIEYQEVCSRQIQREDEEDAVRNTAIQYEKLLAQLQEAEAALFQRRADNEGMKREIARLNHDIKAAKRREKLFI